MSFFAELKRRNVVRVGIAYAVVGWLVLQLTEVLSELLNLPESIGPIVVAAVAIGFPIALVFAWAFELTPDGIKKESDVDRSQSITNQTGKKLNGLIIGLMAVAIVFLLVDRFMNRPATPGTDTSETTIATEAAPDSEAPAIDPASIAVLPFENRSRLEDDAFFVDGIHDDLLTSLSRIGAMKVISRTSVSRYSDTDKSIPEIADELGVATIMEGAVQRAGNNIRITVQLIDAATDEHLWAESYDREMNTENLFAIQSEISGHIAEALQAELTPQEMERLADRPTDNLEAYSAFLRGQSLFATREIQDMKDALAELQHATELDPEFALAWANLSFVAHVLPAWSPGDELEEGLAEAAAQRAMALDPELGESLLAHAMSIDAGPEKDQAYQAALDKLPNDPRALQWYGNNFQARRERWEEILAMFRKAVELDPLAPIYRHQVARQLMFMGRDKEALQEIDVALEFAPNYYPAEALKSGLLLLDGQLAAGIIQARHASALDLNSPFARFDEIFALGNLQDVNRLQQLIDRFDKSERGELPSTMAAVAIAIIERRYAAGLETLGTLSDDRPFIVRDFAAWLHTMNRDYTAARAVREAMLPGLFDPATVDEAVRADFVLACSTAFLMAKTGDPDLADQVLEATLDYVINYLSQYEAHAHNRAALHHCYAIQGDFDSALEIMETLVAHRHYDFWWDVSRLEYFEPLYGDPRFESLMQQFEESMAQESRLLDQLEQSSEAGP